MYDSLQWVRRNLPEGDKNKIVVCGDSAGGNLVAALTHLIKQRNEKQVQFQVLVYAALADLRHEESFESCRQFGKYGYFIDKEMKMLFSDLHFLGNMDLLGDPLAFPLNAQDMQNIPDALILAAELDILRDDNIAYAKKLNTAGVKVGYSFFCYFLTSFCATLILSIILSFSPLFSFSIILSSSHSHTHCNHHCNHQLVQWGKNQQTELHIFKGEVHGFLQGEYVHPESQTRAVDIITQAINSHFEKY